MAKIRLGEYRHSKSGKRYEVLFVGKHSETLEDVVVYRALYHNPVSKLWVRPLLIFTDKVEINGKKVPRFVYLGAKK
jgi:hypothetical protein